MELGVSAISSFMYTCLPVAVVKRAYGELTETDVELAGGDVGAGGRIVGVAGRAVLVGAAVGTAVGVGLKGAGVTDGRAVAVGEG